MNLSVNTLNDFLFYNLKLNEAESSSQNDCTKHPANQWMQVIDKSDKNSYIISDSTLINYIYEHLNSFPKELIESLLLCRFTSAPNYEQATRLLKNILISSDISKFTELMLTKDKLFSSLGGKDFGFVLYTCISEIKDKKVLDFLPYSVSMLNDFCYYLNEELDESTLSHENTQYIIEYFIGKLYSDKESHSFSDIEKECLYILLQHDKKGSHREVFTYLDTIENNEKRDIDFVNEIALMDTDTLKMFLQGKLIIDWEEGDNYIHLQSFIILLLSQLLTPNIYHQIGDKAVFDKIKMILNLLPPFMLRESEEQKHYLFKNISEFLKDFYVKYDHINTEIKGLILSSMFLWPLAINGNNDDESLPICIFKQEKDAVLRNALLTHYLRAIMDYPMIKQKNHDGIDEYYVQYTKSNGTVGKIKYPYEIVISTLNFLSDTPDFYQHPLFSEFVSNQFIKKELLPNLSNDITTIK